MHLTTKLPPTNQGTKPPISNILKTEVAVKHHNRKAAYNSTYKSGRFEELEGNYHCITLSTTLRSIFLTSQKDIDSLGGKMTNLLYTHLQCLIKIE